MGERNQYKRIAKYEKLLGILHLKAKDNRAGRKEEEEEDGAKASTAIKTKTYRT